MTPSDTPEQRPTAAPAIARGTVIPSSRLHTIGLILGAVLFVVVCGYLLYEWWALAEDEGVLPFRLNWGGAILCAVGLGLGVLGVIALPFELVCPSELILGDAAFQVVRRWLSGPSVEVHIPYANMKAVSYEKHDDAWRLGIDLRDATDPETYANEPNDLKQRDKQGRDYVLTGGYATSLQEVARLLEVKRRKIDRQDGPRRRQDDY